MEIAKRKINQRRNKIKYLRNQKYRLAILSFPKWISSGEFAHDYNRTKQLIFDTDFFSDRYYDITYASIGDCVTISSNGDFPIPPTGLR